MTGRSTRDPSPFRSGLIHSALGAFTLTVLLGGGASAMHVLGTSDDASPSVRVALFDESPSDAPQLNPRLPGYDQAIGFAQSEPRVTPSESQANEPDLGVEYAEIQAVPASASAAIEPRGVRINGKTVLPGQTYSQVAQNQTGAAIVAVPSQAEPAETLPAISESSPLMRNARAFANPEGKPTVSIIVGGLGTNATRTRAAINELPPEVTLSFAPTADNLRTWVRQARRAGHEVLIEVPMEPYDYGRQRPHAQVIQTSATPEQNIANLETLLARTPGYIGVMNYQGARFATEESAVQPIMTDLSERGLAFFEDGSLVRSEFDGSARAAGLAFGKSTSRIDARPEADEISQQLLLLETTARERGASLGTGTPFPVTLDILKAWLPTLEDKGIALAPASYYAQQSRRAGQVRQASLNPQG